jgi:glycosyltransferase involved in cell wall biosynthesis
MLSLVREGQGRGWTQLVLNPFATASGALATHFEGVPYETFPCDRFTELPRVRSWLGRRLRDFEPDIVHAHLPTAHAAVACVRRPPGSTLVLTHHHGRHLAWEGRRWATLVDRVSGRRYDRVVACCEAVRTFLLDHYRYPRSKVACIRNGWSGTPLQDPPKASRPTIVCVANLRRQKGHSVLIEAFARVHERIPEAQLTLLGFGPLHDQLHDQLSELGLQDHVSIGAEDDVWPVLGRSHVFALASYFEGLPLAVMEAMAAGLPVVASDVDGLPEVVEPGVAGYLVPAGDPAALAERLTSILGSPALRERMGAAARAAAANLTMERCVARYYDLYEQLIVARAASGDPDRGALPLLA